MRNPTRHLLTPVFRALAIAHLLAVCQVTFAADTNAGLPKLEFSENPQLKEKFKSVSFEALVTQAEQGVLAAQAELGRRYFVGFGTPTNLVLGCEWTRRAATNGLAVAQANLGQAYQNGWGVPIDIKTAVEWYRRAADQGFPFAAHRLGWLSLQKALPDLNPKDALRLYELAAEQGDLDAAHHLAYLYWEPPWHGNVDTQTAAYWLSFAASKGYVPACAGLGWYYLYPRPVNHSQTEADYQEAERWFRMGAELNNPACEYGLAMLELKIHASSPSISEVRKWLLRSAEKNHANAFYQLGRLSEFEDIPKPASARPDYKQAAEWYQRAAALNHREAAARLAELAVAGKIESEGTIIDYLRRASDLDDRNARVELAVRYMKGEASPRNSADSPLKLIESAAKGGNARAKLLLADFYEAGRFVTKDLIRSVALMFSAASYGFDEAYERILKLKSTDRSKDDTRTKEEQDLQQAFDDYRAAVDTRKPEGAALLGRRYLDGTYKKDAFQAAVWLCAAGMKQDPQAAAEAKTIMATFNETDRERAQTEAWSIVSQSSFRLPGF